MALPEFEHEDSPSISRIDLRDPLSIIQHTLLRYDYHISCESDHAAVDQIGLVLYQASTSSNPYEFFINGRQMKSGYIMLKKKDFVDRLPSVPGCPDTPHFKLFHHLTGCTDLTCWVITCFTLQTGQGLIPHPQPFDDSRSAPFGPVSESVEIVWITTAVYLYLLTGRQNYNPLRTVSVANPFKDYEWIASQDRIILQRKVEYQRHWGESSD